MVSLGCAEIGSQVPIQECRWRRFPERLYRSKDVREAIPYHLLSG